MFLLARFLAMIGRTASAVELHSRTLEGRERSN
jgi:hypothetical protein